jgi:hypothetical protein
MKSYHIDHQSFFRVLSAAPGHPWLVARYTGSGEMWVLRLSDEPGHVGQVSIPWSEWAAARDIIGVPADRVAYLVYGWLAWRLAHAVKLK